MQVGVHSAVSPVVLRHEGQAMGPDLKQERLYLYQSGHTVRLR